MEVGQYITMLFKKYRTIERGESGTHKNFDKNIGMDMHIEDGGVTKQIPASKFNKDKNYFKTAFKIGRKNKIDKQ